MSTHFAEHINCTVSLDGTIPIVLPESLRGKTVDILVRSVSERTGPRKTRVEDTAIFALEGILKGKTEEDLENAKDQYLTQKYCHDQDID